MAAGTTTASRSRARGFSLHAVARSLLVTPGRGATALRLHWSRLATTGQLGSQREREIGRHTGARI